MIYYGWPMVLLFGCVFAVLLIYALRAAKGVVQKISAFALYAYLIYIPRYFFFPIVCDRHLFPNTVLTVELRPLLPIFEQVGCIGLAGAVYQMLGNVLGLAPLTFLTAILFEKMRSVRQSVLMALCAGVLIEGGQLVLNLATGVCTRAVDVNDVILNLLGGMLGYGVYVLSEKDVILWY